MWRQARDLNGKQESLVMLAKTRDLKGKQKITGDAR
jgi:hypothetical protein